MIHIISCRFFPYFILNSFRMYFFLILSLFFCSPVSGEVPQEPVISIKSGHLFERRLIEKYLTAGGKCPISGMDLSESDLLPVQGTYVYSSNITADCSYKLIVVNLFSRISNVVKIEFVNIIMALCWYSNVSCGKNLPRHNY